MKVTYIRTVLKRPPAVNRKLGQTLVLENPTPASDTGMKALGFQRALPADQSRDNAAPSLRQAQLFLCDAYAPASLS
jgi:hypothetical protein